MSNDVPTLSTAGWLSDPYYKAAQVLSYFFAANASQSVLYIGRIRAIAQLIQRFGHDTIALEQEIKASLTEMFSAHFDNVEVGVVIQNVVQTDKTVTEDIRIEALVTDKGKTYTLGKLVSVVDSKIVKIIEINNG